METAPKAGYKTSEFWLSVAAMAVGAAFASGVFPTDSGVDRILGLAATVLTTLGYTVSRSLVKR
jgi:hypothetical protein